MKINRVYVEAFGKLKDYSYDFNQGFNLIYGDNEYGKTTLMAFIKMMFFGTPNNAAGRAEREHYMPWSGERCAGYVDFEFNGADYRLVREFAQTNSGDKITLEKKSDSKPEKISPRDALGEKIFGCSLECFERSLFIGNLNDATTSSQALGEINNRLANLVSTGEEDTSAKTVNDRLLKAKHGYMSKGGKIGIYDKGAAKLADLKNDLIEIKEKYNGKILLENKVNSLKGELKKETEVLDELNGIFSQIEKYTRAAKLSDLVAAANDLNRKSIYITCKNGELLSEEHIDTLKSIKLDIKKLADDIESLENELKGMDTKTTPQDTISKKNEFILKAMELEKKLKTAQDEINQGDAELEKAAQKGFKASGNALGIVLGILGGTLIAGAIGLFFALGLIPAIICGVLGAGFTAVSLFLSSTAKKRADALRESFLIAKEELLKKKENYRILQDEMHRLEAEKKHFDELEKNNAAKLAANEQIYLSKQNELISRRQKLELLEGKLKAFCDNLPGSDIDMLKDYLRKYRSCATTLAYISEELGCDAKAAEEELKALGDLPEDIPNGNDLRERITQVQNNIAFIKGEIFRINSEIKTLYNTLPIPAQVEREIASLEETLFEQKDFCDSIDIALTVLEEAGDELRNTWGSELNGKVKDIFALLTGGKYTQTFVTKDLSMTAVMKDDYAKRFIEHLSAGTRDQAYFSLRLAVCELLFKENGSMPIFLDDVFERYDDTRARRGIEFLKKYSKDRQIIFFTCHETFTTM